MAARRGPVGRRRAPMLGSSALPAPRTPGLSSTRRDLEAETPFGTFSPDSAQRSLMRVGRMIPAGRYARKMARPLRSLLRRLSRTPIDVTVLGEQRMRLHPRGNACKRRILILPHLFDLDELRVLSRALNPAGGETQMPNICVARFLGVPSIFCGSLLRGLGPENFSLIISSYDRDATSPRHMVLLRPSAIDPDALGRPKTVPRYGPDKRPKLAGLLIGGNAGPFRYRRAEWASLLDFARDVSKAWGTRWLVSTSRRTPDFVADRVAALAKDAGFVSRFIGYRMAGARTVPHVFSGSG